jgi:8-oxo-dGTP diphosphatase
MGKARRTGKADRATKAGRTPVMAAGGIVVRDGRKPLIAVVQRRRDNAWVLPKGKLKPHERPIAGAKREAMEETGTDVRVGEHLGVISYLGGSGPKIVHFWRMRALDGRPVKLMNDIKAVDWLPLSAAIERLTLPHEQFFLRNVGHKALKSPVRKPRNKTAAEKASPEKTKLEKGRSTVTAISAPPLTQIDATTALPAKLTRTQPRWGLLSRLTKRWQPAAGRAG